MTIRKLQTNFSAGEVISEADARSDLPMVQNGASLLRNAKILATGGVRRRGGLELCGEVTLSPRQHVEFVFNTEQTYQFIFSDSHLDIYDGVTGLPIQSIGGARWKGTMMGHLSCFSWGDFTYVCHPDLRPQQIKRTGALTFVIEDFTFTASTSGSSEVWQPYFRFTRANMTMEYEAVSGFSSYDGWSPGDDLELRTEADYFVAGHLGVIFQIGDGQVEVHAVYGPRMARAWVRSPFLRQRLIENALQINAGSTNVKVYDPFHNYFVGEGVNISNAVAFGMATYDQLNGSKIVSAVEDGAWYYTYAPSGPVLNSAVVGGGAAIRTWAAKARTVDWKEQMYSDLRGWPHCVSGYLGRLIFGGGKQTPNRLSMSMIESPYNFDVGTGDDDESVQVGLNGRRTPVIREIVGAQHLQIFTSEGEYYIPRIDNNANITPKNATVVPQSQYGIKPGLRAREFDGSTIFISKNSANLRQLIFGSNDDGYSSPNLAFSAAHLLTNPIDLTVQMEDSKYSEATAYVINADGTLAVFTMIRSEKIAAWGMWQDRIFKNACVVDNRMFFVVEQVIAGVTKELLVKVNHDRLLDLSLMGSYVGRVGQGYQWQGFDKLDGQPVNVVVDGRSDIGLYTPSAGRIVIPVTATTVEAGFGFRPRLRTMSPELALPQGPTMGEMRRVSGISIRLKDTLGLRVRNPAQRNLGTRLLNSRAENDLGIANQLMQGNHILYMMGWDLEGRIELDQYLNAPMTVQSVNLDVEW